MKNYTNMTGGAAPSENMIGGGGFATTAPVTNHTPFV